MAYVRGYPLHSLDTQKIFGLHFGFPRQKVSGMARPLYAALRAARENPVHSDDVSVWVPRVGLESRSDDSSGTC